MICYFAYYYTGAGDSAKYTLFLAVKDGRWLSRDDPDVQKLVKGKVPGRLLKVLDDRNVLSNFVNLQRPLSDFNFPDRFDNNYHVLVEVHHRRRYYERLRRREDAMRVLRRRESARLRRIAEERRIGLLSCIPLRCNPLS
ncbi:hypothetical protein PHMEG_00039937 [Phytophthora megakarya]|uniref:Uncharacterized protein n=1 Tax=Phytophthora megakarya TaxID=4795 RepID=A0A225UEU3_9STRA|nr:hypothetical protein PHMEG_00039937 [Phytophthora megakarya]